LFTAVQFDLEIDTMLNPTAVIGTAAVTAGKSLTAADLGSGKRRFLIAGLNQTTIQDGTLVSLSVVLPVGTSGRIFPFHLSAAGGADKDGRSTQFATADGVLTV